MDDFKFKKAYGQNFLQDHNIIENIVKGADIKNDSLVIEVGPGSGVLTKELSHKAKNVLAYEIDTRLEEVLDENLANCHNVNIIFNDFLKCNIENDIKEYQYDNLYFVANIPYYITTPILMKIISARVDFQRIVIMIQKEVGDRFTASVGTREYGSITVFLNYYFDIKKLFTVNRNCFIPKPNVDSVVVAFSLKKERPMVYSEDLFFEIIREAFKFKRKNLRNNLKKYNLEKIEEVLKKYNKDLTCRAEELSFQVFVDIANELC